MKLLKLFLPFIIFICWANRVYPQCCAGGSGSPIAGGASQGVLSEHQVDISSNFQYINTNKFLKGDSPDTAFLDNFNSKYIYTRLAYGFSKNFTMSVESGYWINKTQIGLYKIDTNSISGIGDLILFPRFDIINTTKESNKTELTLGLGFKIPLGKYNDSLKWVEPSSGNIYYFTKPLAVQTTSGAQDIIFYAFFFKGYPLKNFRVFTNAIYIKKGWNPIGEKIGDYASLGIFAGKTFFDNLGLTIQLKYEWVDKMKLNEIVYMYGKVNYNPQAFGSKKVFLVPQLSYTFKGKLTIYGLTEIPIYQYLHKAQKTLSQAQIASQYQLTFGFSYRFFAERNLPNPGSTTP